MRFTYDPPYNIAYIRFQEKQSTVESVRVSDELIVDMAPDGTVYGIELLNANEQLRRDATRQKNCWSLMNRLASTLSCR